MTPTIKLNQKMFLLINLILKQTQLLFKLINRNRMFQKRTQNQLKIQHFFLYTFDETAPNFTLPKSSSHYKKI